MSNLTIIIPCFNEEQGIENTIRSLLPLCEKQNWQMIIVNDASNDRTFDILQKFRDKLRIISHNSNRGYGASLKTGILSTDSEYVAFFDADGQHRPEDLLLLYENISDCEMVVGKRERNSYQDWIRKPGKWVLSVVANFLTGKKIPDLNSGLRIVKRDIITNLLHLFPNGFSFSTTSTIAFMHLSYEVVYYPIKVNKRVGKSTVKQIKHGSSTLLLILRLIILLNPLRVFIPVSFWMIGIGIVYEIYGIYVLYPTLKLIPAAFFMILTGIIIFFFGLIADQISALRIHNTIRA